MNINIPINSLVTLVGSSCSGKSFLVRQLQESLILKYPELNFHVVSSDDIRRELIGEPLHKHSNQMLYASNSAFDMLFTKLKHLMSFPLSLKNAVVFVDTTGLNKEFRDQVNKLADEYSYNKAAIVLDYKEYQDYFKYADDSIDKSIISNHVTRLRTKALPQMKSKDYPAGIFRIKQPTEWFADVFIELTNAEEYKSCWLPSEIDGSKVEYTCLGDLHGCFDETIQVLTKAGFTIEEGLIKNPGNKRIVCLGDFIDKNSEDNQKKLIRFIYNNQSYLYLQNGNHEDFVVRYFTGDIKPDKDSLQYFDSINWLKDTPELEELKWLHSQAKPFLVHPDFICTHSPCKVKHLGKLDKESKKAQLKHRLPSIYGKDFDTEEEYKAALESNLDWLKEQAITNFPFIFSGHLSFSNVVRLGSQVMLDTGAVYGNKLTACTVKGRRLEFTQVPAKEAYHSIKYLTTIFDTQDTVDLYSLDPKEQKRVKRALDSQPINWLSGTMSPSASNDSELEPIETALEYYKSKGVTDLVMQCKEMGSNATLYWLPNPDDCYMVSRNGYLINQIDIKPIVDKFHSLIAEKFPDATQVITFGELKPWSALGKGLIDHHFTPIYSGMKAELEFCKENGFDTAFGSLLAQAKDEFTTDRGKLSKSELRAKYSDAKVEWYTSVLQMAKYTNPVDIDLTEVEAYKTELDGYTQGGELDFQPFQVLKIERGKQVEVLPFDNFEGFNLFNNNPILKIFNLTEDYEQKVNQVTDVYKTWISCSQEIFGYSKLEGVVIKPLDSKLTNVAPYIKVRNPQYLKLVYGPTYNLEPTYTKLVKSKRISRKIKSSISEWKLGLEMLGIHSSQMTLDNPKAVELMIKFIAEEKKVEVLDPRL
jgi:predicted kinase